VDVVLALILLTGGVIGAQFGGLFAHRLPGEYLRLLLGAFVLFVGAMILFGLAVTPEDIYSLGAGAGR
jgi:uncharacterized membrane protein YfcA